MKTMGSYQLGSVRMGRPPQVLLLLAICALFANLTTFHS